MPRAAARRPPLRRTGRPSSWRCVAGVVAAWAHQLIFPALSWNRDEPVYLWHTGGPPPRPAHRDRRRAPRAVPAVAVRRPGRDACSRQYTLGWPVVLLAARMLTGTPASALPVGAALAVVGTYALAFELPQRAAGRRSPAALLVASPILAIQGGVYLSYLFTLGIGLLRACCCSPGSTSRTGTPRRGGAAARVRSSSRGPTTRSCGAARSPSGCCIVASRHRRREAGPSPLAGRRRVAAAVRGRHAALQPPRHRRAAHLPDHRRPTRWTASASATRRLMPGFATVDYDARLGAPMRRRRTGSSSPGSSWAATSASSSRWPGSGSAGDEPIARSRCSWPRCSRSATSCSGAPTSPRSPPASAGPSTWCRCTGCVCILAAVAIDHWWTHRRRPRLARARRAGARDAPRCGHAASTSTGRSASSRSPGATSVDAIDDEPRSCSWPTPGRYLLFTQPVQQQTARPRRRRALRVGRDPGMLDLIAEQPERTPYLQAPSIRAGGLGPAGGSLRPRRRLAADRGRARARPAGARRDGATDHRARDHRRGRGGHRSSSPAQRA